MYGVCIEFARLKNSSLDVVMQYKHGKQDEGMQGIDLHSPLQVGFFLPLDHFIGNVLRTAWECYQKC